MKKLLIVAAGLFAGTAMLMTATPASARTDVLVQVHAPSVYGVQRIDYVQPRPVYDDYQRQGFQPRRSFGEHGRYYDYSRPNYREHDAYRGHPTHYQRRDRDGDGVPNRFDARPNNPYRY